MDQAVNRLSPKRALLKVCCVTTVGDSSVMFESLQEWFWSRTSRVRCKSVFSTYVGLAQELAAADLVVFDCSPDIVSDIERLCDEVPRNRRAFVKPKYGRLLPWLEHEPFVIEPESLLVALGHWLNDHAEWGDVHIEWDPGDDALTLLRPRIEWLTRSVIEMYFPSEDTTAYIHSVGGGLSGSPLIRVEFAGKTGQYYLKFFGRQVDFVNEWENHRNAQAWLGRYTVELIDIPEVEQTAERQVMPLIGLTGRLRDDPAGKDRELLYPICFRGAKVTTTLKKLYRSVQNDDFLKDAYGQVVDALKYSNAAATLSSPEMLRKCEDYGPGGPRDEAGKSILSIVERIRTPEFRSFLLEAKTEFRSYWSPCEHLVPWLGCVQALDGLSGGTLPKSLNEQVSLSYGQIHGDLNSRNLLFNGSIIVGSDSEPKDLQIIDCGGYARNAPLVVDLAQLECDLKINLMATEERIGFRDIDVHRLAEWIEQEKSSINEPISFAVSAAATQSVKRAYAVVRVVRNRVAEISPAGMSGKSDFRSYYLYLLYWTLRKLRHDSVPHAKRILAIASICMLYEYLDQGGL